MLFIFGLTLASILLAAPGEGPPWPEEGGVARWTDGCRVSRRTLRSLKEGGVEVSLGRRKNSTPSSGL